MSNKLYAEPSTTDPLSEPTLNRRLWATYLRKGYTRTSFAKALGVGYNLVSYWDHGRTVPSLALFLQACQLLDVSLDAIAHGRDDRRTIEPALTPDEVDVLLGELNATRAEARAFGEHMPLIRGHITTAYVQTWIHAYRQEGAKAGRSSADAAKVASSEASRARGLHDAIKRTTKASKRKTAKRKPARRVPTAAPELLKR